MLGENPLGKNRMKTWPSQSNKTWLKQLAATMLAIWLSGTSCLLCCGPMEKSSLEAENCAAKSSHSESVEELHNDGDCCSENLSTDHSSPESPCQDECCILNAPASELPGTFKLNQFSAMTSPAELPTAFSEPDRNGNIPFSKQHLPEGQKIHLRCCVFLI